MQKQNQSLKKDLHKALEGYERVGILGVGSDLRGDDAAGMLVARAIFDLIKDKKDDRVRVFLGETAPENLTGEIKKYRPTHLIIVDAGDIGKEPGSIALVTPEQEIFGATFSTHKLPIKILVKYLNESFPCKTCVIIIQPRSLGFGETVSAEVLEATKKISEWIIEYLQMDPQHQSQ